MFNQHVLIRQNYGNREPGDTKRYFITIILKHKFYAIDYEQSNPRYYSTHRLTVSYVHIGTKS